MQDSLNAGERARRRKGVSAMKKRIAPMADYRIYCLNQDGGIGFAQWFEADSDEDAVNLAHTLRPDAKRCEVWERGRLIATIGGEAGTGRGDVSGGVSAAL